MTEPRRIYYKYLKKQHLRNFFVGGEIRIGTLFDFQNIERHGTEIGERDEGVKSANKVINWSGGPNSQPAFDKKFFNVQAENVTIQNIHVREATHSINLYVYSVSGNFSIDLMKKMNPEYDACIAINDPKKFFQAIVRKMKPKIRDSAFGHCVYLARHRPHDDPHNGHPGWLKDPEYEYQDEHRLLMGTDLTLIQPINIYCKHATRYCSVKYVA